MTTPAPDYLPKRLATRGLVILGPRANGTYNKGDIPTSFSIEPANASPTSLSGLAPGSIVPGTDGSLAVAANDGVPVTMATEAYVDTATEDIPNVLTELAAIVAENADVVIPLRFADRFSSVGTWVESRVGAAVYALTRAAAAAVEPIYFRCYPRQRTTSGKGIKVTGAVVQYTVSVANLNDLTVSGAFSIMPPTGFATSAATSLGTVTYDADHDTSAKRKATGFHTLIVTFGTPVYLNGDAEVEVAISVDGTAGGVIALGKVSLLGAESLVDAT